MHSRGMPYAEVVSPACSLYLAVAVGGALHSGRSGEDKPLGCTGEGQCMNAYFVRDCCACCLLLIVSASLYLLCLRKDCLRSSIYRCCFHRVSNICVLPIQVHLVEQEVDVDCKSSETERLRALQCIAVAAERVNSLARAGHERSLEVGIAASHRGLGCLYQCRANRC